MINEVLMFKLDMIVIDMLRRRTGYLTKFSTHALLLLALFGAFRVILPFSFPFTFVVNSFETFPMIEAVMNADVWPGTSRLEFQAMILLIWGVGSLVMLIRIMHHIITERMYRQRYRIVKDVQVDRVALSLQLKHAKIIVSPDVFAPYVTGFLRARIFLPDIAMEDNVVELILKHEYQHFKSLDILIKAFYAFLYIVFWWNPIVHIFMQELDCLLEVRCDANMIKHMNKNEKILYMKSLLFMSEHIMAKDAAGQVSATSFVQSGQCEFIKQRFHLIKSYSNSKSTIKQVVSVAMVVIVFIASFMFIIQPAGRPPEVDMGDIFTICPERAHIFVTKDGSYTLYVDGQFVLELDESSFNADYLEGLSIIMED
jgi:beta-lactamase regulating signal transducer with metallopeptidase domain